MPRLRSATAPAPLVPVAVAVGLGIGLERQLPLPAPMLAGLLGLSVAAWLLAYRRHDSSSTVLLWLVAGCLAACWHSLAHAWPADAIGHLATSDRTVMQVRGHIADDVQYHGPRRAELLSVPGVPGYSLFLCQIDSVKLHQVWQSASGCLRVTVEGKLEGYGPGDGLELFGALTALSPPVNPGGNDLRQTWYDHHIQASFSIKTQAGIARREESNCWSVAASMAMARRWIRERLQRFLPMELAGIAQALLCGEQTALTPDQFESYLQTGVYHVLAISGQHLVVLGAFAGALLRLTGGDLRQRAVGLGLFVLGFTLLTGARPPVVRAAAIVLAWCLALWLRRRIQPMNALALAWLVVAGLNPADLASTGCQLSFLAVLALVAILAPWKQQEDVQKTALDRAEEELRSVMAKLIFWAGYQLRWLLSTALVVWLVTMPLIMHKFHLFSPVAVLLGPLMAIPITLALISSMLLVLLGSIPVLGTLLTWAVQASFGLGDSLVSFGKALPWAFTYMPDVPAWWVGIFYILVIAVTILGYWQSHFRYLVLMGLSCYLLLIPFLQPDVPQGLRLTVLSVGHGTAVVLETPDGRCLVYDAGSLAGPEVAYRHLSSYLWYRRRSSIDEVFLSHADLDHFNALPDLLDRFRVGLIRWTPSFSQKPDAGTKYTLATLERKQIATSVLSLGVVLQTEGAATIEVLHPPRHGPAGTENARSLVLLIQYEGRRILLTGDLEEPGLSMVMSSPMEPVDVLVAPHHGSRISNTESFAAWCKPKLVISSEAYPRGPKPDPYRLHGGILWRTWVHGGITVEVDSEIRARTTLTQQTDHALK